MKFVILILAAIASTNAVTLEKNKKGDNWKEDWGYKFDEKHFDENHVAAKWPESFGTVPRGDNPNCSTC